MWQKQNPNYSNSLHTQTLPGTFHSVYLPPIHWGMLLGQGFISVIGLSYDPNYALLMNSAHLTFLNSSNIQPLYRNQTGLILAKVQLLQVLHLEKNPFSPSTYVSPREQAESTSHTHTIGHCLSFHPLPRPASTFKQTKPKDRLVLIAAKDWFSAQMPVPP